MKINMFAVAALGVFLAAPAQASTIEWTDWTSSTATTVDGTMGGVGVGYAGTVPYAFAQLGDGSDTDPINYWTEGSPAPYTNNAVIGNAPTPNEMVALNNPGTHTITFSQAVLNPIMAILSMGQDGKPVTYEFGTSDITLLSEGQGYWGDGTASLLGNILIGTELHAAIQFNGLFSSISWTSSPDEYWHGFTVGMAAVPLPAALPLFAAGLGALGLLGWRKRRTAAALA